MQDHEHTAFVVDERRVMKSEDKSGHETTDDVFEAAWNEAMRETFGDDWETGLSNEPVDIDELLAKLERASASLEGSASEPMPAKPQGNVTLNQLVMSALEEHLARPIRRKA